MTDNSEPFRTRRDENDGGGRLFQRLIKGDEEDATPAASFESGSDPEATGSTAAKVKPVAKPKPSSGASRTDPVAAPSHSMLSQLPAFSSPHWRSPKRPRISEKEIEAQPSLGETVKLKVQVEEMGEKMKKDKVRLVTLEKEVEGLRRSVEELKRKVEDRTIVFNIDNGF
ncbi:hypothetical protein FBEOM_9824 [Fusarium beomiforme]|uniref:Uncharacterized protein n=1 Tax=Fusarium beomiforme TaxID=44412 RepID=A0A9P5DT95_9HYPO|nr:hypothetical protein FBEOM_9824 [Fusarium beomiforme]